MFLSLNDGRKELYQWDTGRTATVEVECDKVHFSNLKYGESLSVEVKEGNVAIPNKLLMSGAEIYCWAFVERVDGAYTKQEQAFNVIKRPKPSDYVYTETEVITIKAAVSDALEKAKESGEFDGPKGDPGEPGAKGEPGDDYVLTNADRTAIAEEAAGKLQPGIDELSEAIEDLKNNGGDSALDTFIANTDIAHLYDDTTGAYYTVIRVYKQKIDGTYQYPFVYAPNGTNAGDKSTLDVVTNDGWLAAINGGLFDYNATKKPDGIIIENGVVIQNTPVMLENHIGAKPLTIDINGNLGYAETDADAYELVNNGIVSAVCGFLPIIVDYDTVTAETANSEVHAQRQIIGQWGNGDYAIVTCEGRGYHNSDGWTLAEAQSVCKKLGLKFAYNLDGGGSTETMLGYKNINTIYEGTTGRKVPTFIVFNGTDMFGKVPDIPDEPDEPIKPNEDATYIYPEYLNVPVGAYINTGIPETELFTCEYKALNTDFITKPGTINSRGHILSSVNTYTSFIKRFPTEDESGINTPYLLGKYKGGVSEDTITEIDATVPHIIRCELNNNTVKVSVDGNDKDTVTVGTTANQNNKYYLFCHGGQPTAERYHFEGHFYYLRLWDASGNLIHDYKPAKRKSDNVCGLLDTVTKVFYHSDTNIAFA